MFQFRLPGRFNMSSEIGYIKYMRNVIWTIGHSILSLNDFMELLKFFQIQLLADIRTLPGSKRYPHFNKESLEQSMPENGIEYVHFKDLGGRRKTQKDSQNTAWRSAAFRGYADYMETEEFKSAIESLESIATEKRNAIMCAEAVWWKCHRSLVADYLKVNGWEVIHIVGIGKNVEHPYTKPARISDGKLSYSTPASLE